MFFKDCNGLSKSLLLNSMAAFGLSALVAALCSVPMQNAKADANIPVANHSSEAERCIRAFINKINNLKSYSTRMEKTETVDGDTETQIIQLQHDLKTDHISLTYVNQGHSGIKNNGMVVDYDGTSEIKIKLGKSTGISTLFHPLVSAVAGTSMKLTDTNAISHEVFTVNRAGFAFLAQILALHDKKNDFDWNAFKIETVGACQIQYRPTKIEFDPVILQATDDIFKIEDLYGQSAFLIYLDNKEKLGSFQKLFERKKDIPIRISKQFTAFDLKLNPTDALPESFTLYHHDKKIGTYQFSETEWK